MSSVKAASLQALLSAATRVSQDVVLSTGDAIPVRGLTIVEVIAVLNRFPKARDLVLTVIGGADGGTDQDFAMGVLGTFLSQGPDALSHLVATAAGAPGDETFAAAVRGLNDEDFTALLEKVVTLTMPEGAAGFFNRLADMAGRLGLAAKGSQSALAA